MNKLLFIIGGYLPGKNFGGPVVSISNLIAGIGDKFDIYVITRNHDLNDNAKYPDIKDGWNKVGKANVMYIADENYNFKSLRDIIIQLDPEVIYQNSFFSVGSAVLAYKCLIHLNNRPLVIAPRGELDKVALSRKKILKWLYIQLFRLFARNKDIYYHATVESEKTDVQNVLRVKSDKVFCIPNCSTPIDNEVSILDKEKGTVKLIYIARIHPEKNLKGALLALKNINGFVEYNVYGPVEVKEYFEDCEQLIKQLPASVTVNFYGAVSHEAVYPSFLQNHALLFPTLNVENYGHTVVESIKAERPVIISDRTPWSSVDKNGAGWVSDANDIEKLTQSIQELIDMDNVKYCEMVANVRKYRDDNFDETAVIDKYENMFNALCKTQ